MKKCPQCGREYDVTMMFCLDDGAELLYGPASVRGSDDEPQTAILHSTAAPGEAPTKPQIDLTNETAILPSGTGDIGTSKSFDKRLLLAPIALAVIVLGGFLGYRYFNIGGSSAINSIAVMPFENRNSDADTDYLSDGLAESVIFRLTQIPDLRVSPTSSVMRYKGKETDVAKIASELGVDAVMTGRLTKRGDNLNITVELVDARTNKSLWGEQYERKMSDLLATQREIAMTITQKLQLKLKSDETGISKKYTDNNEAYQLYLKGRYHFAKRTQEDVAKAVDYFRQATNLDPKFALAYARIADAYNQMPSYPYMTPKESYPQAKAAAMRAIDIDPTLAEAHVALANTLVAYEFNWSEAEREFKRAIDLNPNSPDAHLRYGQLFLTPQGRFDEAITELNRALEIDPLDLVSGAVLARVYLYQRQYDKSLEQAKKMYELDAAFPITRWVASQAYNANGMYSETIRLCEETLQKSPNHQPALRDAGYAYAKSGSHDKAMELLARFNAIKKTGYAMSYRIGMIYVALGDKENAFAELETAFEARDWDMHQLKVDPFWDPLRDDPRFKDLLKRMNLSE